MKKQEADSAIGAWAKKLKVEEYMQMPAEKLSKGNQQKIQFMTAVIHNPDLVVLDEPFSGLDPVNTDLLKNIIIDLVKEGKYVIMSAHQMSTIEEFCSDILILNKGKTVLQGNLREIKDQYPANRVHYALTGSTVSKPEDIQSANGPVAMLAVIGFYLSYFTMMNPTSEMNIFASLFPISSPFCMPFTIMMGLAKPTDVLISYC